jgi:hypothetical protein
MSDGFETIVDPEATAAAAPALASGIVSWLAGEGIIASEPTTCVLGLDDLGYAPGPQVGKALETGWEQYGLHGLATRGLELTVTRTVFTGMGNWGERIRCPTCDAGHLADEAWFAAIDDWWQGGAGLKACAACSGVRPIAAWRGEPYWAFGCLGFTFWNWPGLRRDFVAAVSRRLGHRVAHIVGRG